MKNTEYKSLAKFEDYLVKNNIELNRDNFDKVYSEFLQKADEKQRIKIDEMIYDDVVYDFHMEMNQ